MDDKDKPLSTMDVITKRIIIQIGLYLLISVFVSVILFAIDPFWFVFLPFVTGIIAGVFIIKLVIDSIKQGIDNKQFQIAYLIGAATILLIEIVAILWMMHVIGGIRWM